MSSSETGLELEKLRAEVAALRAAKGEAAAGKAEAEAAAEEAAPPPNEPSIADEVGDHIKSQLEELTDLLGAEIRDLPTITCLAVFTAGILLGRFLR